MLQGMHPTHRKLRRGERRYEKQRDQLYQQQFNVDQVAFAAESVKDTQVFRRPNKRIPCHHAMPPNLVIHI